MPKKKKVEEVVEEKTEEPVEEKEEVKEKEVVETEKKKGNPLGPVVVVLVAIIVLLIGYLIFIHPAVLEMMKEKETPTEEKEDKKETKEEKEEQKNTDEKETKPSQDVAKKKAVLAIGNTKRIGLFDEDFNLVWSHDTEDYIPYADVAVDGKNLYYGVHRDENSADLFRVDLDARKVEDLGIKLNNRLWYIMADNNQVIYDSLFDFYQVDLNTKSETHLDIYSDNKNAFINGTLFYKKKGEGYLNAYNLETKEIKEIDDDARITSVSKTGFIYVNSDNKYYFYNAKTGNKTFIKTGGQHAASGESYDLFLYGDTVYTHNENTIYTISNDETKEVYKLSLKSDESINGVIPLGNDRFLIYKYIDNGPPCNSDVCGPTGETKNLLLNIKTKEVKEVGNEDWTYTTTDFEYIG